jgi:DNA replication protein DnaC
MDRLNDILSNAHLPARQRSPLTRRPLAEQGRRLSQQQEHNAASQPQQPPYKYSVEPRQIRRPRNQAQPRYNQYEQHGEESHEPITRTDYPTYPMQGTQHDPSLESGTAYPAHPHQDESHIQPLQSRQLNDYYPPQADSDDYMSPLHADAVKSKGWEDGMLYGDIDADSLIYYDEEEAEEFEHEQPHSDYTPQPRLPKITERAVRYDQQQKNQQEEPHTQQPPQPAQPEQTDLPKNLHDTRLASAIARQREASARAYQRTTQPLDPGLAARIVPQLAQPSGHQPLPDRDRGSKIRATRSLQAPQSSAQTPTRPSQAPAQPYNRVTRQLPPRIIHETHEAHEPKKEVEALDAFEARENNVVRRPMRNRPSIVVPAGMGANKGPKKAVCPKCHGAGYLRADVPFGHPNFGKPIACECKEAERKEKRRQQLRTMSNLDAYRGHSFESFQPSAPVLEAYHAAIDFADEPSGWLMLIGPNGCGKTHLSIAIANQCLDQGAVVLFEPVPDLLDHLRAAFAPQATEVYDQLFSKMREAELLVLDDLGSQQSSPWANEKLFQLLNYRYNMEMPTVVTANPKAVKDMDERIRSRLSDRSLVRYISMDRARDFRPTKNKLT